MKINVMKKKITSNDIGKTAISVLYNSGYEWLQKQKEGKEFIIEYKNPRNPKFHRMVFAVANFVNFHAPEDSIWSKLTPYMFIKAIERAFGYIEYEYDLQGKEYVKAKSIAFESMTQSEFEELFDKVLDEAVNITSVSKMEIIQNYKEFM